MQGSILLFPSHFHTQYFCNFVNFRLASYKCYVPLFRSLTDSNYLHSAISVILVGNNLLIHLIRILTSLELFLNHEFCSRHPVLTEVYNNGKTVLGEKLFASYESVFELARRLRDSQTRITNKDLGLLVKKEAENICKDNI